MRVAITLVLFVRVVIALALHIRVVSVALCHQYLAELLIVIGKDVVFEYCVAEVFVIENRQAFIELAGHNVFVFL